MRFVKTVLIAAAAVALASACLLSCGKNEEEARKFPTANPILQINPGPSTSFKLANGITVYLQEEHSQQQVAIEVLYRAGAIHELEGKVQLSRLTALMLVYSASASFGPNEAVQRVQKVGKINAETAGDFTHYDYIVSPDQIDLALQVEYERWTSIAFSDEVMETNARKCAQDLNYILNNPRGSIVKYGLMALNQAYNYRKTFVPIFAGAAEIRTEDVKRFHETFYRPEDMTIVFVGDFDTEAATALIKSRFENLPARTATAPRPNPVTANHQATWDIDAEVAFYLFPGPYKDERERLILTMFGSFLSQHFLNTPSVSDNVKVAYTNSYVYTVRDLPFFVFVHPKKGLHLQDVGTATLLAVQDAVGRFSETLLDAIKSNATDFVMSSMLTSEFNTQSVPYHQLIGQEALNVGLKHLLRDGRSDEEYVEFVNSITFEEAKQVLESRLVREKMIEVVIKSRDS